MLETLEQERLFVVRFVPLDVKPQSFTASTAEIHGAAGARQGCVRHRSESDPDVPENHDICERGAKSCFDPGLMAFERPAQEGWFRRRFVHVVVSCLVPEFVRRHCFQHVFLFWRRGLFSTMGKWQECGMGRLEVNTSFPGHLENKWGFVRVVMKAQPRGVYKRRVFCSEDAIGSVDMTEDMKLWLYPQHGVQ
jgi:hypothetical protein